MIVDVDQLNGEIDFNALLLWLYGATGAGRLAIAYSLTLIYKKYGCLLATWFFWKTAAELSNITRFVATTSYQFQQMIFHQSIDAQLAKFIVKPLRHLRSGFDFKDSQMLPSSTAWMDIKIITYNPGS